MELRFEARVRGYEAYQPPGPVLVCLLVECGACRARVDMEWEWSCGASAIAGVCRVGVGCGRASSCMPCVCMLKLSHFPHISSSPISVLLSACVSVSQMKTKIALIITAATCVSAAVLRISGSGDQKIIYERDAGSVTLSSDPDASKLTCSGAFEATDLHITGLNMTVADMAAKIARKHNTSQATGHPTQSQDATQECRDRQAQGRHAADV